MATGTAMGNGHGDGQRRQGQQRHLKTGSIFYNIFYIMLKYIKGKMLMMYNKSKSNARYNL
jgi:hypothetical protein